MIIMITCLVILIVIVNAVFAMKQLGPESVFQDVVVNFAAKKEILEDAVVDVKILKLHMSYE